MRIPVSSGRFAVVAVSVALVLVAAACGGDGDGEDITAGTSPGQTPSAGGGGGVPTGCPLTPAEVASAVGKDVPQEDPSVCRFSDGTTIVEAVVQGTGYFQIARGQAESMYDAIEDAGKGSSSYIATSETGGEAFVEAGDNSATVTMSGIEGGAANYKQVGLRLLDAVLAA